MNPKNIFCLVLLMLIIFSLSPSNLFSQSMAIREDQVEREILIQLNDSNQISLLKKFIMTKASLRYQEQLTRDGLIHSLVASEASERSQMMELLKQKSFVKYVEANQRVESRSLVPDDEYYFDQHSLTNMEMPKLWGDGVNGVTSQGDTIVVAVVELKNTALFHKDLNENLWINHGEIPNDGIDNDQNGYVDDYYGINAITNNGANMELGNDLHGLEVNGVIGAKGNNGLGIAGMAWNVKVMNVTNVVDQTEVVKASDYLYYLRKDYNESHGAKGAYIVASNSSFGIKETFVRDRPIWCEQYNKLYSVGIISISASVNRNVFIDTIGDIPSLCQSEALIVVSNIKTNDMVHSSGYSSENIDLVAYGAYLPLLDSMDGYTSAIAGTSISAPHVTGLVALLYGQACDDFINISKNKPRDAVDLMKGFILDKAIPISSQVARSVTEGKLNPKGTQELLGFYCDNPVSELSLDYIYYNPSGELTVDFSIPGPGEVEFAVLNMLGQEVLKKSESFSVVDLWVSTLDLPQAPTGIYHLVLKKDNETKSKTFMVFRN